VGCGCPSIDPTSLPKGNSSPENVPLEGRADRMGDIANPRQGPARATFLDSFPSPAATKS